MPRRKKKETIEDALMKLKKQKLVDMAHQKNIKLPDKYTKKLIIKLLQSNTLSEDSNIISKDKQIDKIVTIPKKKKRGRRAKNELNIDMIIDDNDTNIKDKKNRKDQNIIVHLSGITLDSIQTSKLNKDPLIYDPVVNIPKDSSSIKESNFAWINNNKNKKGSITSFSFLTKKNQADKKELLNADHNSVDIESNINEDEKQKVYNHIPCIHKNNWYNTETTDTTMKQVIEELEINKIKKDPYNRIEKGRQNILREMQYANRTNKWPEHVSFCCGWDFHEFNTRPIGIPTKIVDGVVHMDDVCCSLECAAAYIFCNEDGMFDDPFEIYSLLHYVYQQNEQIIPAPSRRTLKIRGGSYTIDEFRQLSANKNKTAKIIMQPFLSCIPIQEEVSTNIHINSAGIKNMYIPVNKTQLDKASINIQEYRKKSSNMNNLGTYMNITYK